MEYNYIAILLTENCNARCKMCCDSRGEVKGHTLSIDELNIILSNIQRTNSIKTIGITGGEPMLYPELIEYIFNYNYKKQMNFTIKTNGFWGKDKEKSNEFLRKYKDIISNISFSYDEFHKEYIDLSYIKNIIDLTLEHKISTDIVGCFMKTGMQPGDVLEELGSYAYLTKFLCQPVVKTGSARNFKDDIFVKLLDTNKHELKCLVTATKDYSLAINPNLDVYPCCSQCIENTILNMGNLKERSLEDIINDILYNKVLNTVFIDGFTPFIEILNRKNIRYPGLVSSHCEMCEYLFSSDWFLQILEDEKFYEN